MSKEEIIEEIIDCNFSLFDNDSLFGERKEIFYSRNIKINDCDDGKKIKIFVRGAEYHNFLSNNNDSKEQIIKDQQLFADFIWPGSLVLCDYLCQNVDIIKNKTVIELGAGTGLPSLLCEKLESKLILACDYNSSFILENLVDLSIFNQCNLYKLNYYNENKLKIINKNNNNIIQILNQYSVKDSKKIDYNNLNYKEQKKIRENYLINVDNSLIIDNQLENNELQNNNINNNETKLIIEPFNWGNKIDCLKVLECLNHFANEDINTNKNNNIIDEVNNQDIELLDDKYNQILSYINNQNNKRIDERLQNLIKYDIVLLAEPLWKDTYKFHDDLIYSISLLSNENTVIYLSFAHRPCEIHKKENDLEFIEKLCKKLNFQYELILINNLYQDALLDSYTANIIYQEKLQDIEKIEYNENYNKNNKGVTVYLYKFFK